VSAAEGVVPIQVTTHHPLRAAGLGDRLSACDISGLNGISDISAGGDTTRGIAVERPTELVPLGVRECLACLRTAPVGRLVYTDHALPAIRPVNFRLDDEDVIVWASLAGEISTIPDEVVAFEADEIDPVTRTGWTVVVVGPARPVLDPARLAGADWPVGGPLLGAAPFGRVLRVRIEQISGRRLRIRDDQHDLSGPFSA
jgi:uncharacterized protein